MNIQYITVGCQTILHGVSNSCLFSYRPAVSVNYESMEFYGTSEFWYTMRDVLRLGGDYKARNFETAASDFCRTAWRVLMDRYVKKLYTFADLYRLR